MPDGSSVVMAGGGSQGPARGTDGATCRVAPASSAARPPTLASAERTLDLAADAIGHLREALAGDMKEPFGEALDVIARGRGRLVLSGMGKSGLVGRKIAATFASTGTPAMFVHPAEASHGDLGMVTREDVVLLLSWSGETSELNDLLSYCRRFAVPIIAITAGRGSSLARLADVALVLPNVEEACPNGLAPTSSTTAQMVLGDALAVALLERRGFSARDFHRFHPRGRLGAQFLTVGEVMSTGDAVPRVSRSATTWDAVIEMTQKRFGATAVVGDDGDLLGAFTDGDLRRSLTAGGLDVPVAHHVTRAPLQAGPDMLASDALALMNGNQISQLFICHGGTLVGIVHLHDLLRAGLILNR